MNIVAPVTRENDSAGICVFDADAAKVNELMEEDPAIKASIFTYEILPVMSFFGDAMSA